MKDFKSGKRKDPIRMTAISQATSDEDSASAAEWFATLKRRHSVDQGNRAEHRAEDLPRQGRMRFIDPEDKSTEAVGNRIIMLPMTSREPGCAIRDLTRLQRFRTS